MKVLFDALGLPPYGGARSSALGWLGSVAQKGSEHQFLALVSRHEAALGGFGNLEQIADNYEKVVVSLVDVNLGNRKGIKHINAWKFIS